MSYIPSFYKDWGYISILQVKSALKTGGTIFNGKTIKLYLEICLHKSCSASSRKHSDAQNNFVFDLIRKKGYGIKYHLLNLYLFNLLRKLLVRNL